MAAIPKQHNTISNGKIISSKTIADDKINKLSGRIAALEEKTSTISPHLGTLLHNIECEILNLATETHRIKMVQKNFSNRRSELILTIMVCSLLISCLTISILRMILLIAHLINLFSKVLCVTLFLRSCKLSAKFVLMCYR